MQSPVLLTVAAGGGHPLIDFDGTLLLQLGLFLLTAAVASRLLFRPYLRMREDRFENIEGARATASRLFAEADAQLADYESKLNGARRRAEAERRKIRAEAAAHHQEVTEAARRDAAESLEQSRQLVEEKATSARAELMPRAGQMASDIASKLLGRSLAQ